VSVSPSTMYALNKQHPVVNSDMRLGLGRNAVSFAAISPPTMRAPSGQSPQLVASPSDDETCNRSTTSSPAHRRHQTDKHRSCRAAGLEPAGAKNHMHCSEGAPQNADSQDVIIAKSLPFGPPVSNATSVSATDAQQQQYQNASSRLQSASCMYHYMRVNICNVMNVNPNVKGLV